MQKSITSANGFYLKRKTTATKNYRSVNIRQKNNTASGHRISNVQADVRSTASMYLSKQQTKVQNSKYKSKSTFKQALQSQVGSKLEQKIGNTIQRGTAKTSHRYTRALHNISSQQVCPSQIQAKPHATISIQSHNSNPLLDFKRKTQRQSILNQLQQNQNLSIFLNKVQQEEDNYVMFICDQKINQAGQLIVRFINYTVDLNLVDMFSIALKVLADFYLTCGRVNQALFYYNQTRQSALLLNQSILLIQSLIGIAKCCSKGNLQQQGISILKKALEYSWYYDKKDLELQLYDQIGQKYYHLGDIAKAKKYHLRYVNSMYEPSDSAHKNLSKQRIKKSQQLNIQLKYDELSLLFLVHLKIPIRSLEQVPLITQRIKKESLQQKQNVRNKFNINKKYFSHFQDMQQWMRSIMKSWFFLQQMDQPPLSSVDWTTPLKLKKYAYIDFKLNQHLRKFNNTTQAPTLSKKVQYKQSLDQKVERTLKQPKIDPEWYQKMVQQIVRDHKNKLLNVRNAVRMRGYNKQQRPQLEALKQVYNRFFQKRLID